MNKGEALNNARGLIEKAVEVATKAGLDPSFIVEPYCPETHATQNNSSHRESQELGWCGVLVTIDNATTGLFEMSEPNDDPEQKPVFRVTQSTAELVRQDFERYRDALERMAEQ